jgi:DNA-binding winged helix-turn-helix (wHTH) protein
MAEVSVSAPRIDALGAESGGVGLHSYLCAVESALANQELRQQLRPIIQAYSLLATGSGAAGEQGSLPEATSRAVFAGGRVFSFGPFQLFPSQRLLLQGNRQVQLGSRAFDILTVLVQHAGKVVGKDELIARVWPNVFVCDGNLKTQVCALRRSLDEARAGRCYIVTIPGRGYNFVAPVSAAEGSMLNGLEPRQAFEHDHLYGKAQRHERGRLLSLPELTRVLDPCT